MKKTITALILALVGGATSFAHCGACSTDEKGHEGHDHHSAKAAGCTDHALLSYLRIQDSLASDNLAAAKEAGAALAKMNEDCSAENAACTLDAGKSAKQIANAGDLAAARSAFFDLSNQLIAAVEEKGLSHGKVLKMHCPMAMNGKGASWIQDNAKVRNPYYGASMLQCGMVQASIGETKMACGEGESCEMACCSADKKDS